MHKSHNIIDNKYNIYIYKYIKLLCKVKAVGRPKGIITRIMGGGALCLPLEFMGVSRLYFKLRVLFFVLKLSYGCREGVLCAYPWNLYGVTRLYFEWRV